MRAITLALEHSRAAQAGQADSVRAFQDYLAARADRYPSLSLDARVFRVDEVIEVHLPFQKMELGSIENYQADFRLNLPLFTGGKLSSSVEARQRRYQASVADLEALRLQAAYQARRAYLGLMLAEHLLAAARHSERRVGIIAENVGNLYVAGLADSLDLLEVEVARQQAIEVKQRRLTQRKNAQAVLAQMIGLDESSFMMLDDTLPHPTKPSVDCRALEKPISRPELTKLDYQIKAGRAAKEVATAKYSPNLTAFIGYSGGKPNRDLFNKTWNDYFAAGAAFTWSLNLGNRIGNERQAAEAQVNELLIKRAQVLEHLTLQACTACNELENTWETYLSRTKQLHLAQQKYRLAENKQQAGRLTVNRLLELETELASAEELWRVAAVEYHLNLTEYLYATGAESIYGGL